MIVNTGCRTDIPAYFSEWFYNRIREGYVCVRNPYYPSQVQQFRLSPDVVDCLLFCTKNPEPMLSRIQELSKFHQLWFVTITPYGKDIEPNVPEKDEVITSLQKLSECVGVHAVSWRYDPIFLSEKYSLEFHIETFEKMAGRLSGYVDNCVISFIDLYAKTKRNFPEVQEVAKADRKLLAKEFVRIGKKYGIQIRSCCEGTELEKFGVDVSGCMSQAVVERAIGGSLNLPAKAKKNIREGCDCLLGNDIGVYNTCGHGCIYCYANYDNETVQRNQRLHKKDAPFLIGDRQPDDVVHEVKQESYYEGQMKLWL